MAKSLAYLPPDLVNFAWDRLVRFPPLQESPLVREMLQTFVEYFQVREYLIIFMSNKVLVKIIFSYSFCFCR